MELRSTSPAAAFLISLKPKSKLHRKSKLPPGQPSQATRERRQMNVQAKLL